MSVRQLILYHSLILVFKMKLNAKPDYFKEHLCSEFPYRTRLATGMGIRRGDHCRHEVTQASFVPRSSASWNVLPVAIRNLKTEKGFKISLKQWIRKNVPI